MNDVSTRRRRRPARKQAPLDPLTRTLAARAKARDKGPPSTPDRLLDAAMDLFHRNGYTATGISSILDKAGVNSGSLYYFFPTKEDLLLALLDRYKEMLWPMVVQPVFDRVADPIERVFGILEGYRRMLKATGCSRGCPIGNLALELSDSHPAARRKIAENLDAWRHAVRTTLEQAADRLPPETDLERLAGFVLTVMEGGTMLAKTHRSLDPFEASVAELRDHFDRLLAAGRNRTRRAGLASAGKPARPTAKGRRR